MIAGSAASVLLLYLGIVGIASRESFSIATAMVSGSVGRSFSYAVHGSLAVVMGIGWISAAIAAFFGLVLQPVLRPHIAVEYVRDVALLGFAICFLYVAFQSVKALLFG